MPMTSSNSPRTDSLVTIRSVNSYQLADIQPLVDELLAPLADKLIAGQTAVLKPNLLMSAPPERAITTHPAVIEAVAHHLIERGLKVIIADSPGGPSSLSQLDRLYRGCGLDEVARRTGAVLNRDLSVEEITCHSALTLPRFNILRVFRRADLLINLPKCKTHGMMGYTGAVKNLFGTIPGLTKAEHHFRLPDRHRFGDHLVDVAQCLAPDFHLMDAVLAMEGDGPSGGVPVKAGFLAAAQSPHALDQAITRLIGIDGALVPTLVSAARRNLLPDRIDLAGDTISLAPFRLPRSLAVTFLPVWLPGFVHRGLAKAIRAKPVFVHKKCIGCGKCQAICPAGVIRLNDSRRPVCDYSGCISCFCCHEICPVEAIHIKQTLLGRWLKK